jgi:hypothetical protein
MDRVGWVFLPMLLVLVVQNECTTSYDDFSSWEEAVDDVDRRKLVDGHFEQNSEVDVLTNDDGTEAADDSDADEDEDIENTTDTQETEDATAETQAALSQEVLDDHDTSLRQHKTEQEEEESEDNSNDDSLLDDDDSTRNEIRKTEKIDILHSKKHSTKAKVAPKDLLALYSEAQSSDHSELKAQLVAAHKTIDVSNNKGFDLTFTVTNTGTKPVRFLYWDTPFEGKFTRLFVVRNSKGETVRYVGAQARRKPPEMVAETDFIKMRPGESKSVKLDVTDSYAWTGDGKYYLRMKRLMYLRIQDVMSTEIAVNIAGTTKHQVLMALQSSERMRDKHRRLQLALVEENTDRSGQTLIQIEPVRY